LGVHVFTTDPEKTAGVVEYQTHPNTAEMKEWPRAAMAVDAAKGRPGAVSKDTATPQHVAPKTSALLLAVRGKTSNDASDDARARVVDAVKRTHPELLKAEAEKKAGRFIRRVKDWIRGERRRSEDTLDAAEKTMKAEEWPQEKKP